MNESVLEEKSTFKILGLTFSSNLDWGSYIVSIAKTVSKKSGALKRSMKFLFPEVALCLCKSAIQLCMEYKLQKWVSRTFGWTLSASLELLDHQKNVISLSLFYRYWLDVHLNRLTWFHFLILLEGPFVILIDCMIVLSPFLGIIKMSMPKVFYLTQLDSGIL